MTSIESKLSCDIEHKYENTATLELLKNVDKYVCNMNDTMLSILRGHMTLKLTPFSKKTLGVGKLYISKVKDLLLNFHNHMSSIESIVSDTQDLLEEIKDEITIDDQKGDYVHTSKNGKLVYRHERFIKNDTMDIVSAAPKKKAGILTLEPIRKKNNKILTYIPEYGTNINIQHTNDPNTLSDIFQFYKGGVYCCISNRNLIKVPYIHINESKAMNRSFSIRCRFGTKENCKNFNKFNRTDKECMFAHKGEKMTKIGYATRCNQIPDFGNPETFIRDVSKISLDDIRTILMYGVNDLFIAALWMEYHDIKNKVIENLDIA
jgi:hypothetical protein